uniref:Uncharacterized protein n=1 Tax=viral metagenome TaxID=1070528 RepID=A0A6C0KMQ4_9ZZZZ
MDLEQACTKGDTEAVEWLLDHGAYSNEEFDQDGTDCLMVASQLGRTGVVRILLEKGADVKHMNRDRKTALLFASEYGHTETVGVLLDNGADVNHKDEDGDTALILASSAEDMEPIRLLLEKGANVNHMNKDGDTALMVASYGGDMETIRLLLKEGANPNHMNKDGKTALLFASERRRTDMVHLLLENGAKITPALKKLIDSGKLQLDIVDLLTSYEQEERNVAHFTNQFKNRSLGTCYDSILLEDQDIKNVLTEDKNNIILKSNNIVHCWDRSYTPKYFYACSQAVDASEGWVAIDRSILRDKKYVKFGPDNHLITEDDFKKTQMKTYRIFEIRATDKRSPTIISVDVASRRSSMVSADHCQAGSEQVIHTLDAYSLKDGVRLILPSNNEQKEGGKRWKSRKSHTRHKRHKRNKSKKSNKGHNTKKRSRRNTASKI